MRLLKTLVEEEWPDRCIIFANTKHRCKDIWGHLAADGHRIGLLTSDFSQKRRLRILEEFTHGALDILVAADVVARGLRILSVTHVLIMICRTTTKITSIVSAEPAAAARAVVPSA